jgi:hypothetical protein
MPTVTKSRNEILLDELRSLQGTQITNTAEGSIARALLEIPAASVAEAYQAIRETAEKSFVSSSSGEYLDLIGVLVGTYREPNEPDDRFKFRITNALLFHAKGNITAIKIATELVNGVAEAIIEEGTAGPGSFTVYVVGIKPNEVPWSLLSEVYEGIRNTVAFGTYFEVKPVKYLDVNANVDVIMKNDSSGFVDASAAINAVKNYILKLEAGGILSTDQLKHAIIDALGPRNVIRVTIRSMHISGKLIDGNYQAAPGEAFTINRFTANPINVTIRR